MPVLGVELKHVDRVGVVGLQGRDVYYQHRLLLSGWLSQVMNIGSRPVPRAPVK
jgi:hypothetical protein